MAGRRIEAEEAYGKNEIPKSSFYAIAKALNITGELPPGRKRGATFTEEEVQRIINTYKKDNPTRIKKQRSRKSKVSTTVYRRARVEDAEEMYQLSQRVMEISGGYGIPANNRITYLATPNSEVAHLLIRDNKIASFFTILPLKHETAASLMKNEIRATQIPANKYAALAPGEKIDCFIWEVMAEPTDKHLAARTITKMLSFLHILGKRGVVVENLYVKATSPEGIDLARKMHMREMVELEKEMVEKQKPLDFVPFELNIQQTRNKFTKNYHQALTNYKKRLQEPG